MNDSFHTPVLFLMFNRPDTTQMVFDQIKQVKPKYLFVAADGPRPHKPGETEKCNETRAIINQIDWDCNLKTLFREQNLGLKYGVSSAIKWFFENVEEGIILEDDCCPDLSFFEFCQALLEKYRQNLEIGMIGGSYFHKNKRPDSSFYFSNYPHIWGWASWKRVWEIYDVDMNDYETDKFEEYFKGVFNSKSEKKYWKKIFNKVCAGKIETWDYQLAFTLWRHHLLSITPAKNLVRNLGFKNDSTHFFLEDSYKTGVIRESLLFPLVVPSEVLLDRYLDSETFTNLYSLNFVRFKRLLLENKFSTIFHYLKTKVKKS